MKYGIKALMAAGVLVFAVGVQGALAAPASGKAAVNKENVQASSSAKAEAVPGGVKLSAAVHSLYGRQR